MLNSDLWKQTIKASQYWTLVYSSKTVTVYGGAYETITIDGYYGSFTTNADGTCSHIVPIDTITLTGSVSEQSFTRIVTSETTNVYVMPEGSLYWYGNECTWITGGWVIPAHNDTNNQRYATKNTNNLYFSINGSYMFCGLITKNAIDFNKYTSAVCLSDQNYSLGTGNGTLLFGSNKYYYTESIDRRQLGEISIPFKSTHVSNELETVTDNDNYAQIFICSSIESVSLNANCYAVYLQ